MKRMHHFRTTHGKHQQALMSVYKKPPKERQQQIEDYRLDDRLLRVYTDASELGKKGIFGLAMACVGDGDVIMRSTKYYNQQIRGKNPFAEVAAVSFAIQELTSIVKMKPRNMDQIHIFSDINWIDDYESSRWLDSPQKETFIEAIIRSKQQFQEVIPNVQLSISYIGKDKRFNPFHTAAHNAARRIITQGKR